MKQNILASIGLLGAILSLFSLSSCSKPEATAEQASAIEEVVRENQQGLVKLNTRILRKTGSGMDRTWEQKAATVQLGIGDYHPTIKRYRLVDFSEKKATVELLINEKSTDPDSSDRQYLSRRELRLSEKGWLVKLPFADSEHEIITE